MFIQEYDARVGFRLSSQDKEALFELAQKLGFKDVAAMMREIVKDLLTDNAPLRTTGENSLEELGLRIDSIKELIQEVRAQELKQLRVGVFVLGTEQIKDEEGAVFFAHPRQVERMKTLFPEFTQKNSKERHEQK